MIASEDILTAKGGPQSNSRVEVMHDDLLIIASREDALFGGVKGQTEDVGEVLGDERDGRVGPARESPSHVPHQHPPVIAAWGRGGAEGGEGD